MKRQVPLILVFTFGIFMMFRYFVPHESSERIYEFLLDWIMIIGIFALALGIWSLFHVSVEKVRTKKLNYGYSYVTLASLFGMMLFGLSGRTGEAWGLYLPFVILVLLSIGALMHTMAAGSNAKQRTIASSALLICLVSAILIAIFDDTWKFYIYTSEGMQSTMFRALFDYSLIPCLSTMFSLLAFFISSAAYRAFRARNLLASLLLFSSLIVMLRFFPYFDYIDFGLGLGGYISDTSNWLMNVPNMAAQRAMVIGIGLGIVATAMKVILGIERGYMGKG